jgi:serine kinase of HPr protein (carbohydrate metabolism regulator)
MDKKVYVSFNDENIKIANGMAAYFDDSICWLSHNELKPIDSNLLSEEEQKLKAIKDAKFLVLILSKYSNSAKSNLDEVKYAFNNNTKIITFRIENIAPSQDLEPYLTKELWFDAFEGSTYSHLKRLEEIISE